MDYLERANEQTASIDKVNWKLISQRAETISRGVKKPKTALPLSEDSDSTPLHDLIYSCIDTFSDLMEHSKKMAEIEYDICSHVIDVFSTGTHQNAQIIKNLCRVNIEDKWKFESMPLEALERVIKTGSTGIMWSEEASSVVTILEGLLDPNRLDASKLNGTYLVKGLNPIIKKLRDRLTSDDKNDSKTLDYIYSAPNVIRDNTRFKLKQRGLLFKMCGEVFDKVLNGKMIEQWVNESLPKLVGLLDFASNVVEQSASAEKNPNIHPYATPLTEIFAGSEIARDTDAYDKRLETIEVMHLFSGSSVALTSMFMGFRQSVDELYMRNDACQALEIGDINALLKYSDSDLEDMSDDFETQRGTEEIKQLSSRHQWSPNNPESETESLLYLIKNEPLGSTFQHESSVTKSTLLNTFAPYAIVIDGSFLDLSTNISMYRSAKAEGLWKFGMSPSF